MGNRMGWLVLSTALIAATAWPADKRDSLIDVTVVDMQRVAPAQYSSAAAVAARGGAPLDIALAIAGAFEGSTQKIIQVNERAEAPSSSHVTVLRDGLLDDSVRGERWEIVLERSNAGPWRIVEVKWAWRCWRGTQSDRFAATPCP